MPQTTRHQIPYPEGGDAPLAPAQFQALANRVDEKVPWVSTTTPPHVAGLMWFNPTTSITQISDGSAWHPINAPATQVRWSRQANQSAGTYFNLGTAPANPFISSTTASEGTVLTVTQLAHFSFNWTLAQTSTLMMRFADTPYGSSGAAIGCDRGLESMGGGNYLGEISFSGIFRPGKILYMVCRQGGSTNISTSWISIWCMPIAMMTDIGA